MRIGDRVIDGSGGTTLRLGIRRGNSSGFSCALDFFRLFRVGFLQKFTFAKSYKLELNTPLQQKYTSLMIQ
jgi:hypothetical protein